MVKTYLPALDNDAVAARCHAPSRKRCNRTWPVSSGLTAPKTFTPVRIGAMVGRYIVTRGCCVMRTVLLSASSYAAVAENTTRYSLVAAGFTVKRTWPAESVTACAPLLQVEPPPGCDCSVPVWFGSATAAEVSVAVSTAVAGHVTEPAEARSDAFGG